MTRVSFFIILCVLLFSLAGCGMKQEAANSTPAQNPSIPPTPTVTEMKAKSDMPKNIHMPVDADIPTEIFGGTERTASSVKPYNYYVDHLPKLYLQRLGEAVARADGFRRVAGYLDAGQPIYEAEKKYVEECFAKGANLRLVDFGLFEDTKKGRLLEKDPDHHLYELKVHVKYTMEYTYANNSREMKKMRKVFTMRQKQVFGRKDKGVDFAQIVTVVITDIEDVAETTPTARLLLSENDQR